MIARGRATAGGVGWEFVHVAVDDHSRIAFARVMPSEKKGQRHRLPQGRAGLLREPGHQGRVRHDRLTSPSPSAVSASGPDCATSAPSPTRRGPTARPNASFRPACQWDNFSFLGPGRMDNLSKVHSRAFPAKWEPVRRRKCDHSRTIRANSDSTTTEFALKCGTLSDAHELLAEVLADKSRRNASGIRQTPAAAPTAFGACPLAICSKLQAFPGGPDERAQECPSDAAWSRADCAVIPSITSSR